MTYLLFDVESENPLIPKNVEAAHWKSYPGSYLMAKEKRNWYHAQTNGWVSIHQNLVPPEMLTVALLLV